MATQVYANGKDIAAKAGDGKSVVAMPDVCLSPPSPPAGPLPIPYPNNGMASDITEGSKNTMIGNQEVALKHQSYMKQSTGDEAATKGLGMGVVTHQIQGKVNFLAWSMNVKFEGENVPRHMDLTGHNETGADPANGPPWLWADLVAFADSDGKVCEDQKQDAKKKCAGAAPHPDGGLDCSKNPGCKEASACVLTPKNRDGKHCCHPGSTGHHLVEVHCFTAVGGRKGGIRLAGFEQYNPEHAPCACAEGGRSDDLSHGVMHAVQGQMESAYAANGDVLGQWAGAGLKNRKTGARDTAVSNWSYGQARDSGVMAHKTANPQCNAFCTRQQLDDYHKGRCGMQDDTPVRTDTRDTSEHFPDLKENQDAVTQAVNAIRGATPSGGAF
jgi:hypothetical protein